MQTVTELLKSKGIDFDLEARPVAVLDPETSEVDFVDEGTRAIVRTDNNAILAYTSDAYEPISPLRAFGGLDIVSDAIDFDAARCIDGGKIVAIEGTLRDHDYAVRINGNSETLIPRFIFHTRNDGRGALRPSLQLFRLVCDNGLIVSTGDREELIRIPHVGDVDSKITELNNMMAIAVSRLDATAGLFQDFHGVEFPDERFRDYVTALFKFDASGAEDLTKRAGRIIEDTIERWHIECERTNAFSLWAGYNAITGNVDHGRTYKNDDTEYVSTTFGNMARMKTNALALAAAGIIQTPEVFESAAADPRAFKALVKLGNDFISDLFAGASRN